MNLMSAKLTVGGASRGDFIIDQKSVAAREGEAGSRPRGWPGPRASYRRNYESV